MVIVTWSSINLSLMFSHSDCKDLWLDSGIQISATPATFFAVTSFNSIRHQGFFWSPIDITIGPSAAHAILGANLIDFYANCFRYFMLGFWNTQFSSPGALFRSTASANYGSLIRGDFVFTRKISESEIISNWYKIESPTECCSDDRASLNNNRLGYSSTIYSIIWSPENMVISIDFRTIVTNSSL